MKKHTVAGWGGGLLSCPEKVSVRFPLVSQPPGHEHTTLADQAHTGN